MSAPVEVGPILRDQLFNQTSSVILTSATLAIGSQDFRFFRQRVGVTDGKDNRQGSPFDYQKQAKLIVVNGLPDPSAHRDEFERAIPYQIKRFAGHTDGHTFVLLPATRCCAAAPKRSHLG